MIRLVALGFGLLLIACGGPRQPGAQAGQYYFWKLETSTIEIGACSDEPGFRSSLMPLVVEPNSYFTYQVSSDKKTAVRLKCTTLDSTSCKPLEPAMVLTITGTELLFTNVTKSKLGSGGCFQTDTTSWTLTDLGEKGTLDINHVLSLTDNPTACAAAEKDVKAQSPNMIGLEGCVVAFKVGMSIR